MDGSGTLKTCASWSFPLVKDVFHFLPFPIPLKAEGSLSVCEPGLALYFGLLHFTCD